MLCVVNVSEWVMLMCAVEHAGTKAEVCEKRLVQLHGKPQHPKPIPWRGDEAALHISDVYGYPDKSGIISYLDISGFQNICLIIFQYGWSFFSCTFHVVFQNFYASFKNSVHLYK